jgi:hypothetical protein
MYESGNNPIAITTLLYLIFINPKAINELGLTVNRFRDLTPEINSLTIICKCYLIS